MNEANPKCKSGSAHLASTLGKETEYWRPEEEGEDEGDTTATQSWKHHWPEKGIHHHKGKAIDVPRWPSGSVTPSQHTCVLLQCNDNLRSGD